MRNNNTVDVVDGYKLNLCIDCIVWVVIYLFFHLITIKYKSHKKHTWKLKITWEPIL